MKKKSGKFDYGGSSYEVFDAKIVNKDGVETPIPSFIEYRPELHERSGVLDNDGTIYSFPTPTLNLLFEVDADDGFFEFLKSAFREPSRDEPYYLDSEGRVYCLITVIARDKTYAPQWTFINVIDRQIWRYALSRGLQLEDAVRELNHLSAIGVI